MSGVVIASVGKIISFIVVLCRPTGEKRCFQTLEVFLTTLLSFNHMHIVETASATAGVIAKSKLTLPEPR